MSILQIKYNDTNLLESEICINEEYTVASRKVSRLPQDFVQYWIDTGHLPYQTCVDNAVHSDIGSSLTEEESLYEKNAVCNTMLKYKLNDKQLSNNGSSNSSVDTAAYVLSNTNIAKKDNLHPKFFKKDGMLKTHMVINYTNKEIDTAANIYNAIDSNISNRTTAFDIHSSNKMYQRGAELKEKNIIKGTGFKLQSSCKENIDEICKDDDQISGDDLNCQNEECVENSTEEARNITNINKSNFFFDDLHEDSIKQIRQKKLYIGRESPIDIKLSVESDSVDIDINEEKQNLHPAYRNSPLLQKSCRKYVPKKRKYEIFFKNLKNKSDEDTSSNASKDDNTDIETHNTKRLRSIENSENDVAETQFFSTFSQTSNKDKLRQSCREMEKQIKRFSILESVNMNKLKQQNHDHTLQGNITYNKKHLKRYVLKSQNGIQQKVTQIKVNVGATSHKTLHKKPNPIVLLERLSAKVINQYIHKKDLQSKKTKKNISIPIKNMIKDKNKRNYRACKNTESYMQLKKVAVDSGSSSASTIIIYNHTDSQFTSRYDSNDLATIKLNCTPLPNSDNTEKNQLETFSSDIKLTQMRPVVVLQRLHATELSNKKHACKLNNLKNKWQPVVVLEPLININGNWRHKINSPICNEFNETEANEIKNRETSKKMNHTNEHSKKLLCFKTKIYSDSDSDDSSTERSFNSNISMKYNIKNKKTYHKSFNSLRISMRQDFESPENRKTNISRTITRKQKIDNKHMNMQNYNLHMSMNNGHKFLGRVSCVNTNDNRLDNSKSGDNRKVHSLPTMKLAKDKSGKGKDILENNIKDTVIKDSHMKNKRNTFVFVTKAYDSDSD